MCPIPKNVPSTISPTNQSFSGQFQSILVESRKWQVSMDLSSIDEYGRLEDHSEEPILKDVESSYLRGSGTRPG